MPRGGTPEWARRKQPILDSWVLASMSRAGGKHDAEGRYATLVITGLADRAEVTEYVRALHRAGVYLHKRGHEVGVHCDRGRKGPDGKWVLSFRAVDKTHARQRVMETYGPDPSKWPYHPRRKGAAS